MKKLVKLITLVFLIINFSTICNVFGEENYINKASLINKYLYNHKAKIEAFTEKYQLENDEEINLKIDKINYLINALETIIINKNNLDYNTANKAIVNVLNQIKTINDDLRIVLVKRKNEFEKRINKKQKQYSEIGIKLSGSIDRIITVIKGEYLNGKQIYSLKEAQINKAVGNLEKEYKNLKYFSKKQFDSEENLSESFLMILKNIKKQMKIIKESIQ